MITQAQKLNIAFISRSTLYQSPGGDTVQMEMTAKYLRKIGHHVQVFTTNEQINYQEFDLFHFFNITRPADILVHIPKIKKPFFISPIYLDLQEYERKSRNGFPALFTKLFKPSRIEYLKCIARYIMNGEKIESWDYIFKGHHHSIQKLLKECTAILPNSQSEYARIQQSFTYKGHSTIIPCGVDLEIFDVDDTVTTKQNIVLCVGRIEGRKNQLSLIRALNNSDYTLIIVGNPSPNHKAYYEQCKKTANKNVIFIENIEQEKLLDYYRRAKVHVLPSWFETVGLSSLEAAICGCNVVVCDKGDVKDYFKDKVWYCDPNNETDILNAITRAMNAPSSIELKNQIRKEFTWQIAAQKTLETYQLFI